MKRLLKQLLRQVARIHHAYNEEKNSLSAKKLRYRNLSDELKARAINTSADFVEQHLEEALVFHGKMEIRDFAIEKISQSRDISRNICLEFGVFTGGSINYFSKNLPAFQFHGFDSFEGLNEDWFGNYRSRGYFDLKGKPPLVNENVSLHQGWYTHTLTPFLDSNDILNKIAFIHMDSDTYDSTKFVLETLLPYLNKHETLILFDDFLSYPNWINGEHKALYDCKDKFGFQIKYLGFSDQQALVSIEKIDN